MPLGLIEYPVKLKGKVVFFSVLLLVLTGCSGGTKSAGTVNPNFPDVWDGTISPSTSVDTNNLDAVVVVEPGPDNQGGAIGTISEQETSHTLCVIIDPASGNDADLEACEANKANEETTSVNGICPEADAVTRCASHNAGSGPDFCQVTGARDYIFVMMNLTAQPVTVAYQVVDVTSLPNKSCADLGITEETIQADDF